MKTTISVVVLLATAAFSRPQPGLPFLLIWPTARSTALAGAMTALADEADATYFNPAGLAFQTRAKADVSYGNWLPGLYPGRYYAFAAGGAPLRPSFLRGRNAYLAGSLTYMAVGETDVVNEHGDFLGRYNVWRGAISLSGATSWGIHADFGLTLKGIHIHLAPDGWRWDFGPEHMDGTASTLACDAGMLWRPSARFSLGGSVANLGPGITYAGSGEHELSPTTLRAGASWTPVESRDVRLCILPELTKLLVGMFSDTTGKSFGRQLNEEWRDVWKAVGIEATAFNLVSLRLGYFEDLNNQRGGVVLEKEGQTYHYGLWDALTHKSLGELKRIGLCWGFGIGYKDYFRIDVSSDAAIYDFPTSNWKVSLVANDIAGGIRRLKQGHEAREE